ncbi:LysR family transcriptional regulator [Pseudonocardia hierapolitana]|uniref:LysR family transcriptional regulator n=1 Tax=Pseudonocardia hierapolitana TaxID=1128676 RepID=A0A561T0P3_9PSEU|nr:LysR family transcriptional regulator [Pseudonocardia hierapolitana]TWF80680.1 LysR family transcriptional regulator [Pseudonocardia hierapolitana]
MRYRRLGYFVAVAEELSFTRAAQRLHMAQPPLSQQIALLEKEIGTPLFDRSRRTIRLTAAGAALLPEARRLLTDLDETVRMVRSVGDGTVGRLAVGFVPSAINGVLADLLREFRATHPAVELTLREMAPDALLRAVHDRRLDLAVLYLPVSDPDLDQRRLASEELLLALPEAHPAAAARAISLADVADEPFVLPERHDVPGLHAAVTALFTDAGVTPRIAQRGVWLIQTVLGLVAAGTGLAVVPSSATALRRHGVLLRPLTDAAPRLELAAIWRRDNASSPLKGLLDVMEP